MITIYYCAWCKHIRGRDLNVFYSSKICKKHLKELKNKTQGLFINNKSTSKR